MEEKKNEQDEIGSHSSHAPAMLGIRRLDGFAGNSERADYVAVGA